MTKKYKILGKYIKDMSSETPDIETYIFVRDYISKYQLNIDINSKELKNKILNCLDLCWIFDPFFLVFFKIKSSFKFNQKKTKRII